MKTRIDDIAKLWVEWNSRQITAEEFASKVGDFDKGILKRECQRAWRHYILSGKIKRGMMTPCES